MQPLESKPEFLDYIYPKLKTIQEANATVFAEMGAVSAYGRANLALSWPRMTERT